MHSRREHLLNKIKRLKKENETVHQNRHNKRRKYLLEAIYKTRKKTDHQNRYKGRKNSKG